MFPGEQKSLFEMASRQTILDPRLRLEQPVQRFVGLAVLHLAKAQHGTQTGRCRLLVNRPHKAELGAGRNQPIDLASPPGDRNSTAPPYPSLCIGSTGLRRSCGSSPALRRHDMMQRTLGLQVMRARPDQCPPFRIAFRWRSHGPAVCSNSPACASVSGHSRRDSSPAAANPDLEATQ
jgi:hypothetical protein